MAKLYAQKFTTVASHSGTLAAAGSSSGSMVCDGYSRLVGFLYTSCALESASGLRVEQSMDYGSHWDLVSASDTVDGSATAACNTEIVGNAVRVTWKMGGATADAVRCRFMLKPVD